MLPTQPSPSVADKTALAESVMATLVTSDEIIRCSMTLRLPVRLRRITIVYQTVSRLKMQLPAHLISRHQQDDQP